MSLPSLETLYALPLAEAEMAIRAALPTSLKLVIQQGEGRLEATVLSAEGDELWFGASTDRRVLLFNAYGHILRAAGARPRHPAWQRKGEVQIPTQYGMKSHQGSVSIPDPEDLDPEEILSIYGIHPKKDDPR